MKHKKKGRKIYTYHARNRRIFSPYHPMRSAIGTAVTLVLVAVLGFVGYNIVGPIVTRVNMEAESPTATPEPYFEETVSAQTTVSAPEIPADTTAAASSAETTVTTVTTVVTTTETTVSARFASDMTIAYLASAETLTDLDTVEETAEKLAKQGYNAMILPLKLDTGMLQYASVSEKALGSGAANGNLLTLREIQNAAHRYGVSCIAQFSTLSDHVYPNADMNASYSFQGNGGTTRWLDNKPDEGGKPWLDPFSDAAKAYLADLAKEIQESGFSQILCTDTVFPHFYNSDADLLGSRIQDNKQRKNALTSVLNEIAQAAPNAACAVDLRDIIDGTAEAFAPDALNMQHACIRIAPDAFEGGFTVGERRFDPSTLSFSDKIPLLAKAAQAAAGSMSVTPCFVLPDMTDSELETAVQALYDAGFRSVYFAAE